MAWTTPRTWIAGELVTSAVMNAHIRDNLLALFAPSEGWPANPILKVGLKSGTTDGGGRLTVTFGTPFPTALDHVQVTGADSSSITVSAFTLTTVNFLIFFNAASVARSAYWLAVGH